MKVTKQQEFLVMDILQQRDAILKKKYTKEMKYRQYKSKYYSIKNRKDVNKYYKSKDKYYSKKKRSHSDSDDSSSN